MVSGGERAAPLALQARDEKGVVTGIPNEPVTVTSHAEGLAGVAE